MKNLKKVMRIVFIFFLMVFLGACTSSLKVISVKNDTKIKKEGVFYFLPKTMIAIDVSIKETRYFKGPFFEYSSKFTGINNVIQENKVEYSLQNIKYNVFSIPDTSKLYYIQTSKLAKKDKFIIDLDDNGNILALNCDSNFVNNNLNNYKNIKNISQNVNFDDFEHFAVGNTQVRTDTIIEKMIVDTITIEKQILQHKIIEKSLEDKARDAANYIELIADNKMKLISGYQEVNYDKNTLALMILELDKQLMDYTSLFTGKTFEQDLTFQIIIDPSKIEKNAFLFSINSNSGLGFSKNNLVLANNYYYSIIPENYTEAIPAFSKMEKKKSYSGLLYSIPETCVLNIFNGNANLIISEKVFISQLGTIGILPKNVKKIIFNPLNGSIKHIEK